MMNSSDLLCMSFNNLMRRKTRTVLTVLGVVIGTASIIIMLSLGIAMDQSLKDSLKQMGSLTVIEVSPFYRDYSEPGRNPAQQQLKLDNKAVSQIEQLAGVEAVMPVKTAYMKVAAGKMVAEMPIIGVNPDVLPSFDFEAEQGRLLMPGDKEVLLFGSQTVTSFYNPRLRNDYGPMDPTQGNGADLLNKKLILTSDMNYGERLRGEHDPDYKPPRPHEVKGIGILKQCDDEKDYQAYMNIAVLEKILAEDRKSTQDNKSHRTENNAGEFENVKVKVTDINHVKAVLEEIKVMGFQTYSPTEMLESMKKQSRTVQAVLGGIGAISLLVAAIGIANTMIMSIYERTREIGVIKVLGANLKDIKRLFLLEAAMIGLGGGVIGLGISYLGSWILNYATQGYMSGMNGEPTPISIISPTLAIAAVAFATLVGIISGYSPARRAMNLSALEAIRNE